MNNLSFSRIKKSSSLKSYINYVENFCPLELCNRLLEESDFRRKLNSVTGSNTYDKRIRDACDIQFSKEDSLFCSLQECFYKQLFDYVSNFDLVSLNPHMLYPEITVVSYLNQRGYIPHVDASLPYNEKSHTRFISIVAYLNDDYIGGDIYFPEIGVSFKPKQGSCLVFPSDNLFKHGVKPVRGHKLISPCWFYSKTQGINPFGF
jgi:prolyl 4-hydroxylase